MKYILKYHYNMNDLTIVNKNNHYIIKEGDKLYTLIEFYDVERLTEIQNLLVKYDTLKQYNEIVKTKYNQNLIEIGNKKFVLIKNKNNQKLDEFVLRIPIKFNNTITSPLNRSDWYSLWKVKNDYIEMRRNEIVIDGILKELHYYFMGMAETALIYLKYIEEAPGKPQLYISRERITNDNINSPLNIVIDCRERDLSEYMRWSYFYQKDYYKTLTKIVKIIKFEKLSYVKFFARLLYPIHYFDILDSKCFSFNVKKLYEYDIFLKKVYSEIEKYTQIKKIDWL